MNVFVLDEDMVKSAMYTCDKHVVKMITEHVQLLSSAYYFTDQSELSPYKLSHQNHPIAKWVRESKDNWTWLRIYTLVLYGEYKFCYHNRNHRAGELARCLKTPNLPKIGMTRMALAMPEQYKVDSVVQSYRNYYIGEKLPIIHYTNRELPYWLANHLEAYRRSLL